MYPSATIDEITTLLDDEAPKRSPEFHLDYENYLKPYVEETAETVDRELIESHVEFCPRCRDDLRDIISFHQELQKENELKHLSQNSPWANLSDWLFTSSRRMVWVAFASVMILAGAGTIWVYFNAAPHLPEIADQNEISAPVDVTDDQEPPADAARDEPANAFNGLNKRGNTAREIDETELAALKLPGFLNDLRQEAQTTLRSRGKDDAETERISVIGPNGKVIRGSSPVLTWQSLANIQNYEVEVFDENDNPIARSEMFAGNSWRVSNLPKGKLYQWQVSAKRVSADGKATNVFGKGKFYVVSQAGENRINKANDPFEKGKAFAENGLLREAANEFRKYLAQNPNSEAARKFLRQVEQKRRF